VTLAFSNIKLVIMLKKIISVTAGLAIVGMVVFSGCTKTTTVVIETPINTDTATMSFSADIQPVFNASCALAGCHVAGAHAPNLTQGVAYQSLTDGGYVIASDPTNSQLMMWLTGKKTPVMPLGSGPDPEINAKVYAWINQGALNN
jgi:hypothetical protein